MFLLLECSRWLLKCEQQSAVSLLSFTLGRSALFPLVGIPWPGVWLLAWSSPLMVECSRWLLWTKKCTSKPSFSHLGLTEWVDLFIPSAWYCWRCRPGLWRCSLRFTSPLAWPTLKLRDSVPHYPLCNLCMSSLYFTCQELPVFVVILMPISLSPLITPPASQGYPWWDTASKY